MQEVKVHTWCDRHSAIKDERVPGTARQFSVGSFRDRELDLCADCWDEVGAPLIALLQSHSRPGATSSPASKPQQQAFDIGGEPTTCPLCDKTSKTYAALLQHVKVTHGVTLASLMGEYCPICGAHAKVLGAHTAAAHGTKNVLALLRQAEADGDPHGVAAVIDGRFANERSAA